MKLNKKDKTLIILIIAINIDLNIYFFYQIQITLLDIRKIIMSFKYIKYTNIFYQTL